MLYSTHIYTQCRLWFEQTWKNYSTILTQSLWELDVGVWRFGRLNWWLVVFFSVVIVVVRCWFEWLAGWINKFRGLYSKSNETQTLTHANTRTNKLYHKSCSTECAERSFCSSLFLVLFLSIFLLELCEQLRSFDCSFHQWMNLDVRQIIALDGHFAELVLIRELC